MRACPFVLFLYLILFLCQLAVRPVSAGWRGNPPLKMEFDEHEFLAACREGNVPAVRFYLANKNFDPNGYFISGSSGKMNTGIFVAAETGRHKVIRILVGTERIDLNLTRDGATPVFIASQNGHHKVVKILANIEGVDLNRTWDGATPVFIASQEGHDQVVQILADTERVDLNLARNGATPVFIASQKGHDQVVQLLVDAGADPTVKWKYGWGIFSKTARTIATERRPFTKRWNPKKHDAYSRIIQTLRLAEHQWKKKTDDTHFVSPMTRLSVTGK